MSALALATALGLVVLVASIISVEVGLSVAILELLGGVIVGNAFGLESQPWLNFVAAFASIVLTFLAGAEVDVDQLRREWKPSVAIGLVSFGGPFLVAMASAHWLLGWTGKADAIAGIALSTTSLAVVYAVLVKTGLNRSRLGKLLMSATFVTDFGTATALSLIFIRPNAWFAAFLIVSVVLILLLPRIAPPFFKRYGDRVIEPEIKLVFVALFLLMYLGQLSGGHAILPAFVLGLVMARHYQSHLKEQERLRVVAFAFLTPLFFVKGGLAVSLSAVWTSLGALGILFAAKMLPKLVGIYPLARRTMRGGPGEAWFGTLLMSTGLTFGTISSLYGLNAGIIDRTQFSLLMTVVVGSAVVPTFIAQRFFTPYHALENGGREPTVGASPEAVTNP
ncbi:MAG: cation:proton antiporter [Actinobacteria bacterium]|nr:cation:proton antiporter [Actinomycetota bacterium]